jgi:hypothetical protein
MIRIIRGAALAALALLSACAHEPTLPYDRTASASNKTIGLLTPGWPSGPSSVLASSVGQSFGLVGALVDAGLESAREKNLVALLKDQNIDAQAIFITALTEDLQKAGYTVVPVPATGKDATRTNYLKTYPAGGSVDSYLDIPVFNYGYIAAGIGGSTPYRPWFTARVKLVRAADHSVLMQDMVGYNPVFSKDMVNVSPAPEYAFDKWDDVTANPQKAAEGLHRALEASADSIANLIK